MNETRLIDANELKALRKLYIQGKLQFIGNEYDLIDKCPTIDAEPVRHGWWEYKFYPTVWYGPGEPPEWICSLCDDRAYNTYDYCPNCGAKMDGGKQSGASD